MAFIIPSHFFYAPLLNTEQINNTATIYLFLLILFAQVILAPTL